MIDQRAIFEMHRLAHEGLSVRKIAKTLGISRQTTSKYLADPAPPRPRRPRPSQLDPFKDAITHMLEIDSKVSAVILRQRLAEQGFTGGLTIVRQYLTRVRQASAQKRAFIRFESAPGEQCQIDWGHFGSIGYGDTQRKLYCLAVIECHSRLLYLEFTHSQRQETLHRCLLQAFRFFQGTPKELVHDNMLTAVLERQGPLVRFNEANVRVHTTTGQPPIQRFDPKAMRSLPELLPDCRDTTQVKVHTDFSIRFDGNTYTVPPWLIGKTMTVKADHHQVTCYFKDKPVATHFRCWQRKQRIELPQHREAAHKHHRCSWYSPEVAALLALGETAKRYLEHLATTNEPLKKQVKKLLALKDEYGAYALLDAMQRATLHQAFGAHYIENILYQEMTPQRQPPTVRLKQPHLNQIRLEEPVLADYDAFVLKRTRV